MGAGGRVRKAAVAVVILATAATGISLGSAQALPDPAPTVTAVSPSSGPLSGGTNITVTGTGFATVGTVSVKVGGKTCASVVVASDTSLSCTTGARGAGAVDVVVKNPDTQSGRLTRGYSYLSALARPKVYWTRQFGGSADDVSTAVATGPGGDIWVYGWTRSNLGGTDAAERDVFLARYSKSGTRRWLRQFGTSKDEQSSQRIVVTASGDAYLTGSTMGIFSGETAHGPKWDVFVAKFDRNGNKKWVHQYGSEGDDYGTSVARSGNGDLYVSVETHAAFPSGSRPVNTYGAGGGDPGDAAVMKVNKDGVFRWAHQFGSTDAEWPWDIAVSRTNEVYLTGGTSGDLDSVDGTLCNRPSTPSPTTGCTFGGTGTYDGFLVRFDTAGNIVWAMQSNSSDDDATWGVAVGPGGDVYIGGWTNGYIGTTDGIGHSLGNYDSYVSRYSKDGVLRWTNQHGTTNYDSEWYLVVAPSGTAYVAGYTLGAFPGFSIGGGYDAYVTAVSADGTSVSTQQFSTPGSNDDSDWTFGTVIAIAPGGGLVMVTPTKGATWGGSKQGNFDVALSHIPVPGSNKNLSSSQWVSQLGVDVTANVTAVKSDSAGNTFVFGQAVGNLEPGRTVSGASDLFVAKYDKNGNLIWLRQFGTDDIDVAGTQIALANNGDIVVSGSSTGKFPGTTNSGGVDGYAVRLDRNGIVKWATMIGTSLGDDAYGVAVSAKGDVYVALDTQGVLDSVTGSANLNKGDYDAAIVKLDKNGTVAWARQRGGELWDQYSAVLVSAKNEVYGLGYTNSALENATCSPCSIGNGDAIITKFDSAGTEQWTKVFGSAEGWDGFYGGNINSKGEVYATGDTDGAVSTLSEAGLPLGNGDSMIMKINSSGSLLWAEQHGTDARDDAGSGGFTRDGWYWMGGLTRGALTGYTNQGQRDAYVFGISPDGTRTKFRQFGTAQSDYAFTSAGAALAVRPDGTLVLATASTAGPWGMNASSRTTFLTAIPRP